MPLFFQHSINDSTAIGIWKIEEPESFFLEKVPLKQQVTHPYKRLQHLAGRYLLPSLFGDFPIEEIRVADTRRPFLHDEKYHFSISHCGNFAAAIASSGYRVGVDVEFVTPRMYGIAKKFMHPDESRYLDDWKHLSRLHLELVTIVWSAKEAIFKWYGNGQLDFKKHMQLSGPVEFRDDQWIRLPFVFLKWKEPVALSVEARMFDHLVLAQVVS